MVNAEKGSWESSPVGEPGGSAQGLGHQRQHEEGWRQQSLKRQHPGESLKRQHPGETLKRQHPGESLKRQHPGESLKQQHREGGLQQGGAPWRPALSPSCLGGLSDRYLLLVPQRSLLSPLGLMPWRQPTSPVAA